MLLIHKRQKSNIPLFINFNGLEKMSMIKKIIPLIALSILPMTNAAMAKPAAAKASTATIYGQPFYPSEYTPEMMVYARNVKTGKTYSFKVAEDARQYKMTLPAPATYIFFSWTTQKIGSDSSGVPHKVGAVLSECDGNKFACNYDYQSLPKPISLKPGQVIKKFQIANYYYPSDQDHLYVPKP